MQDGEVDSYASDPMSPQAYRCLCDKAMEAHDSFDWCWLTLQWNLIQSGKNVATFSLVMLGLEQDVIVF